MSLLNLSLGELLALFLPIAATIVALYLYDRAHRRQIVSTLRFFERVRQAPVFTRRKKIQQPWSLVLQLVSLALLLLAIAQLELGRRGARGRDHVLILETSAWMNTAAPANAGPRLSLMQLARRRALEYLRAPPSQDRVMLIRADQLATPVTPFTRDRKELEAAIRASEAGSTALNLSAALELARNVQSRAASGGQSGAGEIVVVGSGRVAAGDVEKLAAEDASRLRTILLGAEPNNCGIRKLSARRSPADPSRWDIDVGVYNYGPAPQRPALALVFGGSRIASATLAVAPHAAAESSFQFRSSRGGVLEAVLDSKDDYRADNRAAIELARLAPLKVQVFSSKPDLWRPLLTASPFLDPEFHRPGEYNPAGAPHRLIILDGFNPSMPPNGDAVWIAGPATGERSAGAVHVRQWNSGHPIAAGLHNKDVRVTSVTILRPKPQDVVVAECEKGPVLLASAEGPKRVVFGFHPLEEGAENQVAVPLLFANLARWVSPELFRATEVRSGPPGLVELQTPAGTRREQVQVSSPQMRNVAFTLVGNRLRFFTAQAGTVRVTMPERELVYTLNLPEVGEARWTPPPGVRRGVPPAAGAPGAGGDLWPWLATAGALGLLLEWILYGRRPAASRTVAVQTVTASTLEAESAPEPAAEEVHS